MVVNGEVARDRISAFRPRGGGVRAHPLRGEVRLDGLAVGVGERSVERNQFGKLTPAMADGVAGSAVEGEAVRFAVRRRNGGIHMAIRRNKRREIIRHQNTIAVDFSVLPDRIIVVVAVLPIPAAVESVRGCIAEEERTGVPADRHRPEHGADRRHARRKRKVDAAIARAHAVGGYTVRDGERSPVGGVGGDGVRRRVALVGGLVLPLGHETEGLVLELEVRGV